MRPRITQPHSRLAFARGGFTLIELVVVMLLTAILAASAIPAIGSITNTRQTVAAKTLLHGVTLARQNAVATGTRTWVVFDDATETWSILVEDPQNPGRTNAALMTDVATGHEFSEQLDTGDFSNVQIISVAFDGGAEIGFDWQGRPLNDAENDLAANGLVVLSGNHRITVEVETGHIQYVAP